MPEDVLTPRERIRKGLPPTGDVFRNNGTTTLLDQERMQVVSEILKGKQVLTTVSALNAAGISASLIGSLGDQAIDGEFYQDELGDRYSHDLLSDGDLIADTTLEKALSVLTPCYSPGSIVVKTRQEGGIYDRIVINTPGSTQRAQDIIIGASSREVITKIAKAVGAEIPDAIGYDHLHLLAQDTLIEQKCIRFEPNGQVAIWRAVKPGTRRDFNHQGLMNNAAVINMLKPMDVDPDLVNIAQHIFISSSVLPYRHMFKSASKGFAVNWRDRDFSPRITKQYIDEAITRVGMHGREAELHNFDDLHRKVRERAAYYIIRAANVNAENTMKHILSTEFFLEHFIAVQPGEASPLGKLYGYGDHGGKLNIVDPLDYSLMSLPDIIESIPVPWLKELMQARSFDITELFAAIFFCLGAHDPGPQQQLTQRIRWPGDGAMRKLVNEGVSIDMQAMLVDPAKLTHILAEVGKHLPKFDTSALDQCLIDERLFGVGVATSSLKGTWREHQLGFIMALAHDPELQNSLTSTFIKILDEN